MYVATDSEPTSTTDKAEALLDADHFALIGAGAADDHTTTTAAAAAAAAGEGGGGGATAGIGRGGPAASKRVQAARRALVRGILKASATTADDARGRSRINEGGQGGLEVSFTDLEVVLPSGQQILRGVSGHLRPGRLTAIMGPSGAGKTALLSAIMGKVASKGHVLINGEAHDISEYRSVIG